MTLSGSDIHTDDLLFYWKSINTALSGLSLSSASADEQPLIGKMYQDKKNTSETVTAIITKRLTVAIRKIEALENDVLTWRAKHVQAIEAMEMRPGMSLPMYVRYVNSILNSEGFNEMTGAEEAALVSGNETVMVITSPAQGAFSVLADRFRNVA